MFSTIENNIKFDDISTIMSIGKILGIIFTILALLALLATLLWISRYDEYEACLKNPKIDRFSCFSEFIMLSPPIQEATELAEACNQTNEKCLVNLGMKVVEEKVTE